MYMLREGSIEAPVTTLQKEAPGEGIQYISTKYYWNNYYIICPIIPVIFCFLVLVSQCN